MNKLLLAAIVAGITQAESAGSPTELSFGMADMTISGTDNSAASWDKQTKEQKAAAAAAALQNQKYAAEQLAISNEKAAKAKAADEAEEKAEQEAATAWAASKKAAAAAHTEEEKKAAATALALANKKKEEAAAAKTKADDEKAAAAAALAKSKEMTHAANKYSYWSTCHTAAQKKNADCTEWAKGLKIAEIAVGAIIGIIIGIICLVCVFPCVIWRVFFFVEEIEADLGLIDDNYVKMEEAAHYGTGAVEMETVVVVVEEQPREVVEVIN